MSRTRIGRGALVLTLSVMAFGAGVAAADRVVVAPPPVFIPEAEFQHENGYYRTNDGRYYHYDKDRSGWHYGKNHDEGVRYERKHEHEHEHEGEHRQ